MRIIAGEARGRRLQPVQGRQVRPTSDRVREALFSILAARYGLPESGRTRVLDLYAGTGALGLEAVSRGAAHATLVEGDPAAAQTAQGNARLCGFEDRVAVRRGQVGMLLPRIGAGAGGAGFDLIFLDPPYAESEALAALLTQLAPPLLNDGALVVAEHDAKQPPADSLGVLMLRDRRSWGTTAMSFYRCASARTA
jgi:16S rRNA (guanine(966)-N(2))-methyltransferase RsmD